MMEKLKAVGFALLLIGALNFYSIVLAFVILYYNGTITQDKLNLIVKLAQTDLSETKRDKVKAALESPDILSEKDQIYAELEKQYIQAGGREKFFENLQNDINERRQSLQLDELKLTELKKDNQELLAEITVQKERYLAAKDAFNERVQSYEKEMKSEGFEDAKKRLEEMEPRDVAELFDQRPIDEVAQYIKAFKTDFAGEVLVEIKKSDIAKADAVIAYIEEGKPETEIVEESVN